MKRTYIAPQSDIEVLNLIGSIMGDPGYDDYSPTTDEVHSNTSIFDEEDFGSEFYESSNLWEK